MSSMPSILVDFLGKRDYAMHCNAFSLLRTIENSIGAVTIIWIS